MQDEFLSDFGRCKLKETDKVFDKMLKNYGTSLLFKGKIIMNNFNGLISLNHLKFTRFCTTS